MEDADGFAVLRATGIAALDTFMAESGGHRWQRIPPTEKRGRYQTSTVTVAVMPEPEVAAFDLPLRDVEITFTRGSGKGGQHKNTTDSCCVAVHRPSGIRVRCDAERSQHQNKAVALALLRARLADRHALAQHAAVNDVRKAQVGSGQRGDKIRTYRVRDNTVTDHRTGRKARLDAVRRGDFGALLDGSFAADS